MTLHIQPSRFQVACYQIPYLGLSAAFPLVFVLAIWDAGQIPAFFWWVFALTALGSFGFFVSTALKTLRILRSREEWEVSIENGVLFWKTGLAEKGFPIELPVCDIVRVNKVEIWREDFNQETSIETVFELVLSNGDIHTFNRETAGLDPHPVFLALGNEGVPYQSWLLDKQTDPENQTRQFEKQY